MSYPCSTAVVPGQATEADQYNFLRKDALYLGGEPDASGSLLDLLYQNSGEIRLRRVSGSEIALDAGTDDPCALMIGGRICCVKQELTMRPGTENYPSACRLFIFAAGKADGTFELRASESQVLSGCRMIGTLLWSGSGVIPGTLHTLTEWKTAAAGVSPFPAMGRLTLVPGDPAPDTDITRAETLYFTPCGGNLVSLYLSGGWELFRFSELPLSLSGLQRGIPSDIFLAADEQGLRLSALSWGTSAGRPAGMISRVDGVRVSGSDPSKRYLGTVVLNDAGFGEDSRTGRLLWNEYNRLPRPLLSRLVTDKNRGSSEPDHWVPYYDEDAPSVRILVPDGTAGFTLEGVGLSSLISESDRSYMRASAVGICRDMNSVSPYSGNQNCAAVFTHSCGCGPLTVRICSTDSSYHGCHRYTLAFWTNYSFYPIGTDLSSAMGECPGLFGELMA